MATAELPRLQLVSKMLGREVQDEAGRTTTMTAGSQEPSPNAPGIETGAPVVRPAPLLEARGVFRRGAVQPLDLTLRRGEVMGLAGLLGSGRTETARLLFGIDPADGGEVRLKGGVTRILSPRDAVQLGIAFCSEDRKTEGILPNLSVRENLIFALQAKRGGRAAPKRGPTRM